MLFVCKQKTAYVMRISDWSADVCSSDLDECIREGRSRSPVKPGGKGNHRCHDYRRHEPASHLISQPLNWRSTALRGRDHLYDRPTERRGGNRCVRTW